MHELCHHTVENKGLEMRVDKEEKLACLFAKGVVKKIMAGLYARAKSQSKKVT